MNMKHCFQGNEIMNCIGIHIREFHVTDERSYLCDPEILVSIDTNETGQTISSISPIPLGIDAFICREHIPSYVAVVSTGILGMDEPIPLYHT